MRIIILIVVSFFAQTMFAQKDTAAVLAAVQKLEKAFTTKDSATVNALLHKDVVFAHSNGWVQTKKNRWPRN